MAAGNASLLALVVVTVILALFTIVFAELVPKTLALAHPERFALTLSRPIDFLARILGPVVRSLTWVTRDDHPARSVRRSPREAEITAEELRLIVERGGEQGVLEAEEEQMINAVIELGERRVHEVMVPRVSIVGHPRRRLVRGGHRRRRRRRATRGSRPTRIRSTRSSGSSTPRTSCRT